MTYSEPLVYIVVLNWNGVSDTLDCLRSIFTTTYPNFQVLVIDNNSVNDELTEIKRQFPEIFTIQSQKNLGFTGGCNLGIENALQNSAQYIWLLNNDAIVFPNTLASLVDKMQKDPKIGMISPIVYDMTQKHLLFCGRSMDLKTLNQKMFRSTEGFLEHQNNSSDLVVLPGTALLIRKQVIEELGPLDDKYFAYYEDTDYSIRAVEHGWKNYVDTEAKILHGRISERKSSHFWYYMTRNKFLLIKKHASRKYKIRSYRSLLICSIRKAATFKNNGEIELSRAILSGLWDALHNNFGKWNNQRQVPLSFVNVILRHPHLIKMIFKSRDSLC